MKNGADPKPPLPSKSEAAARGGVALDAALKQRNLKRLRRIEGQLRGLQGMVEQDRACPDILTQIASVHEALRAVARELMRSHFKQSAARTPRGGAGEAAAMYDELIELMHKYGR